MRFISKILIIVSYLFGMGTQFLSIPMTASDLGLGMNPLLNRNGLWNPALLQAEPIGSEVYFSHGNGLGDLDLTSINFIYSKGKTTRSFNLRYSGLNDLELRENKPQSDPIAFYTASGLSLDGTISFQSKENHFGVTVRWVDISLYMENSNGFAMDFGYWRSINKKGKIGLSLLNIGKMNTFLSKEPSLPIRFLGGLSWESNFRSFSNTAFSNIEYALIHESVLFNIGNEIRWKNISFQTSVKLSQNEKSFSSGIGMRSGLYGIQYAIQVGSQNIGTPQILDFYILLP
ncbi:MAG: hypothetical protein HOG73_00635 [Candidatus Marinimicrobia bacterium]|nr:hypothetical protein [Candidatus Neomarinimicrobiota bacterium]MBT3936992.1 hypothetical protein [Candidatus Neomarinimicrobiota bacterium]MBT3960757.1 hypothetical protein [Candidatus Neomarinimicrobiota bacterium]MBT4383841.1 hypothetical protein [Candidatus Neomarinimicrobiota bacterium]MBT4636812.1 hypothetical protein [Candidatus Neomarinimicrobiota bacterium]